MLIFASLANLFGNSCRERKSRMGVLLGVFLILSFWKDVLVKVGLFRCLRKICLLMPARKGVFGT